MRLSRGWKGLREAGPRQLALTALLLVAALLIARFSWSTPVVAMAENALYDWRAILTAPHVEQDPRITIVVYDDQTLIAARKRSPLDRGLLARALRNLDGMGAKAIGLDMLFDQPQDEDDDLVATLRAMKTPVSVGYAEIAGNKDDIIYEQQQYLDSFLGRLKGSKAHAASVQLPNEDGATRGWPERSATLPPTLSRAMMTAAGDPAAKAFADYDGAQRYRLPALDNTPVYTSLRIDTFADPVLAADPEIAAALSSQISGRYILIGGDIVDTDRVETTFSSITKESVPGIQIHASMLAQMMDGTVPQRLAGWQLWLLAILVVLAAGLTSLFEQRIWRALPFLAAQLLVFGGLPFLFQQQGMDSLGIPAFGWIIGWVLAFTAVGSAARAAGAEQRRFAQGALGKYLPRDIASQIIEQPELLALHGEKQEIFVLFSDLEGFTKMSHALEPEMVAILLNRYLEMLSNVVLDHGGVIDKFVGDAVVAFWGAPIARADDGLKAAQAGYAIWQAGETFRNTVPEGLPPIGKTRVGLHFGDAVVGNFGGEGRIQYTALGDSMNTAARLESANKELHSNVMASREFAERSGLDWWRPMGRVVLRGRAKPVDIFQPVPEFPAEDRAFLTKAIDLLGQEEETAIRMITELAARYPSDDALQNLLVRTRNLGKDKAYVLG